MEEFHVNKYNGMRIIDSSNRLISHQKCQLGNNIVNIRKALQREEVWTFNSRNVVMHMSLLGRQLERYIYINLFILINN